MALTIEWKHRVELWEKALWDACYHPLQPVELEGFATTDHLTPQQALLRTFQPMPPGTPWGAKWEYGWFRGSIQLPPAAAGQRIVLCPDVGGEALVAVNGQLAGAVDREHRAITLTRQAHAGACYDILMEAYAGHGPLIVGTGPTPPGRQPVPEPGPGQVRIANVLLVSPTSSSTWNRIESVSAVALAVASLMGAALWLPHRLSLWLLVLPPIVVGTMLAVGYAAPLWRVIADPLLIVLAVGALTPLVGRPAAGPSSTESPMSPHETGAYSEAAASAVYPLQTAAAARSRRRAG
uniref:Alpha-mannosidase Ams1-like N-terminal domain-containing protein n=1 Tax=Bellilinea caldifistulae TaxID=360411 RepID=A0A7C4KY75_9CHLR